MQIELSDFVKLDCKCGRSHELTVKKILIEAGALNQIPSLIAEDYKNPVIVCDDNTYEAAGAKLMKILAHCGLIVLEAQGLHADNRGVALVMEKLKPEYDIILAVGAGTIHDISRYAAYERDIPFVSVPTAASVDGFVSTVAAMTWDGMKKTLPAEAPIYVAADSDIFSKAPYRLTASGISDLLGKYTAVTDWKIANLVTGEYICEYICELEMKAVEEVREHIVKLKDGDRETSEKLMYALILSGLAMQMVGNSRPASGAEHHISHLWEMEVINDYLDAYHGEKVSVGLIMAAELYHFVKEQIREGRCSVKSYGGLEMDLLEDYFGEKGMLDGVIKENTPDPLGSVDIPEFWHKLTRIADILEELPKPDEIMDLLTVAGCMKTMEEAGVSDGIRELTYRVSPYVRNRLTFMRLIKLLEPDMIAEFIQAS